MFSPIFAMELSLDLLDRLVGVLHPRLIEEAISFIHLEIWPSTIF